MKVELYTPPWGAPEMTNEGQEAIEIIGDNLWAESSVEFYAERDAKLRNGKRAPKGMQATLNKLLVKKFKEKDWLADSGYFLKKDTWVRITFRHQMSLGSDFIDAQKVCALSNVKLAIILAADRQTLDIITPNDSAAIISFEKLQREVIGLNGVIDIPLLYGKLTPKTHAAQTIESQLMHDRPRDITVPAKH
ncbi:MAG: hypothetical protein ACOX69_09265 [Coriobacteriales bacterium]